MAAIVLSQLATSMLAPSIYGVIGAGASVASSGFLWSVSQGLAGFAGSMVGSAIDRALFGTGAQNVEGPRLNDLTVQSSADGAALPRVYGTYRLAGNVIWSTGLEEIRHTESVGGGSGGGGGSVTTYAYRTDAAIAICEGEIAGVRRIWADTKLIYDIGSTASLASIVASSERAAAIRIYTGSSTQAADPLIQAIEGAASTPAYRGVAYVVFEDLQLADFGNRLPNFQFEVVRAGSSSTVLAQTFTQAAPTDVDHYAPRWSSSFDGQDVRVNVLWGQTYSPDELVALNVYLATPSGLVLERYESTPSDPAYPVVAAYDGALASLDEPGGIYRDYDNGGGSGSGYIWRGEINRQMVSMPICKIDSTTQQMSINDTTSVFPAKRGNVFAGISITSGYFCISQNGISVPYAHGLSPDPNAWCISDSYVHLAYIDSSNAACYFARFDKTTGALVDQYTAPTGATCCNGAVAYIEAMSDDELSLGIGKTYSYATNAFTALSGLTSVSGAFHRISDQVHVVFDVQSGGVARIRYYASGLTPSTQSLQTVVEDVLGMAGMSASEYDCTALASDVVRGYAVGRQMSMRAALDPLMAAYHFDLIEEGGKLLAVKRGGAIDATISDNDLGASESPDGVRVSVTRTNPVELPSEIAISYPDTGTEYQIATQYARRLTAPAQNKVTLSMPLVLTSQEAARLAEVALNVGWWSGRESYATAVNFNAARLSPADRVNLPVYGNTLSARITEVTLGKPGIVDIKAVPDVTSLYSGTAVGADTVDLSGVVGAASPAKLMLLDCVMLRDQDTGQGLYLGMCGYTYGWPGGGLYKSNDGGATWGLAATVPSGSAAVIGYATTVLADHGCTVWDRVNTVTLRLYAGATLSSATELAVLNGANAALLGAHGRWELIQFQTATLNGDGSYTLSNLLRGRRGTDYAAASHALYDVFVLLSTSTTQIIDLSSAEIGAARHYKAVTNGRSLEGTAAESLTYTGERLECLSPVDLRASRDGSGNITLTWKRRDRINAGWNNYSDIPMSEASEAYEVDIYASSAYATVTRTLTGLTSASASYTAAQQVTDFGATQATVYARVYQLSATVGRGHYRQGAV